MNFVAFSLEQELEEIQALYYKINVVNEVEIIGVLEKDCFIWLLLSLQSMA